MDPTDGARIAVLAVDDNARNLVAIEAMLASLEVDVVFARSGREALTHILSREFAVLLLDVQMPEMDGLELASLIRGHDRFKHLPIIFLTAYAENPEQVRGAYALGAVDFLFKPIVSEILCAKIGVFLDLTRERARAIERVLVVDELRRRTDELGRTDRRKDEFLAVLGHELRNPLAPILYAADLMKSCPPGDRGFERLRLVIETQALAMSRIVDDLLDVSRINEGKVTLELAPSSVNAVVDRAVETSVPLMLGRGHRLDVVRLDPDIEVSVDRARLVQALSNLLNNAAQYTDEGGRIRVAASTAGEDVLISVSDNGRGIATDVLPRVFETFVQADATGARSGLGLGLAVVKHLVELHGGSVAATSGGPGRGAEFVIRIPASVQRARPEARDIPLERPTPPLRILIVDDDRDNRELLQLVLENLGHRVRTAENGAKALADLAVAAADLALVDLGLPDMSGYDVARRLRVRGELGPAWLVALTGFGATEDRALALASGFDDHLVKPVASESLRRVLSEAWSRTAGDGSVHVPLTVVEELPSVGSSRSRCEYGDD